jgi:hypothetical protein
MIRIRLVLRTILAAGKITCSLLTNLSIWRMVAPVYAEIPQGIQLRENRESSVPETVWGYCSTRSLE